MLAQFLDCVLPASGGFYAAQLISKDKAKRFKARSFKTIPELQAFMLDATDQLDVTFCLATLSEKYTRKTQHVLAIRSFRADIDLPPDIAEFQLRTKLPDGFPAPTAIVASGGGLHVYWSLSCDLPYSSWHLLARGLEKRLLDAGVPIEQKLTTDAVRPPRAPSTFNHKYDPPRRVELVEFSGARYDPVEFAAHLPFVPPEVRIPERKAGVNDAARITPDIVSDPAKVALGCAHIAHFAETGCREDGEEPLWKACAGVLKFCLNGEMVFHNWSRKDERYDGGEAQAKLDARNGTTGGSLCSQFAGISPAHAATCQACPHFGKIKSPIVLGYPDPPLPQPVELPPPYQAPDAPPVEEALRPAVLATPEGFTRRRDGSLCVLVGKGDTTTEKLVCGEPVYFVSRSSTADGQYFDTLLHCPQNAVEHYIEIPSRCHASPVETSKVLMEQGLPVGDPVAFVRWIIRSQELFSASRQAPARTYSSFGWNEQGFLWGDRLFTSEGVSRPRIPTTLRDRVSFMQPKGSLEAWKAATSELLSDKFPLQRLALLASFGAPLINFLASDEGGAIVHLVSADSGTGKSTGLHVAASVWGELKGLQCTLADTKASTGIKWGQLAHLPPIFDELVQRKGDEAEQLLRLFTGGADKGRAMREGDGLRKSATWNTILLSAGNASLVQTIQAEGHSNAMAERVLEFEAEMPRLSAQDLARGQKLRDRAKANAGQAGLAFAEALIEERARLADDLHKLEGVILGWYPEWGSNRRYWVRALASMLYAGCLASSRGLIAFDAIETVRYAAELLDGRHAAESRKADAPDLLAAFLNAHLSETLATEQFGEEVRVVQEPRGKLVIRKELGGSCYITKGFFRAWLAKCDLMPGRVLQELKDAGILVATRRYILGTGTQFTSGATEVLEVQLSGPRTPLSS